MSQTHTYAPDPFSVAVPFDFKSTLHLKSYENTPLEENTEEDQSFGMNCFGYYTDPYVLPEQPPELLVDLDMMRVAIESLDQTLAVLMSSDKEMTRLCLDNYKLLVSQFNELIDTMKQKTFNEMAWHTFTTVLKHRSVLIDRRKNKAILQRHWYRLKFQLKCIDSWGCIVSRGITSIREISWQTRKKELIQRFKIIDTWGVVVSRNRTLTSGISWQRQRTCLWLKFKRIDAWGCLVSDNLTLTRRKSWQRQQNDTRLKLKTVNSWGRIVSSSPSLACKHSMQWHLEQFRLMLRCIDSWNSIAHRNLTRTRKTLRYVQLKIFKSMLKCRGLWKRMVVQNTNKSRSNRIVLTNEKDRYSARLSIENWSRILKNKASIQRVFFNRCFGLKLWSTFCVSLLKIQKYTVLNKDELSLEMIRVSKQFGSVFSGCGGSMFADTYGTWPQFWKKFREASKLIFARLPSGLRTSVKEFIRSVFCATKLYLVCDDKDPSMVCTNPDRIYLDRVQNMFNDRYLGRVIVNWDDLSLRFYIPGACGNSIISFSIPMFTIENIVGLYYIRGQHFKDLYMAYFRKDMIQLLLARNTGSDAALKFHIQVLKTNLKAKYVNRFIVSESHAHSISNGLRVVIKCMIVRKADNEVSGESRTHECGIFEAIEQLGRRTFDNLLRQILRFEDVMKIKHEYGTLLEHWDSSK
jgi:hypothetical protein